MDTTRTAYEAYATSVGGLNFLGDRMPSWDLLPDPQRKAWAAAVAAVASARQTAPAAADTAHLRAGERITVEEAGLHASAFSVLLRQLARALETPAVAVEFKDAIGQLERTGESLADLAALLHRIDRIVEHDVPLAVTFPHSADPWGAAAVGTTRTSHGGAAVIPTPYQLGLLADQAEKYGANPTTTFREAMAGIAPRESRAAAARRAAEREAAITAETLRVTCTTASCGAGDGEHCRTTTGRIAALPHQARLKTATQRVDERLATQEPTA